MIRWLIKVTLYLIAILLIITVAAWIIAAMVHNILFIIGFIIALPISPILYKHIEKKFQIQFPDYIKTTPFDIISVVNLYLDEIKEFEEEAAKKQQLAQNMLNQIEEDIIKMKKQLKELKSNGNGKEITTRTKKALQLLLGNPKWTDVKNYEFGEKFEKLKL